MSDDGKNMNTNPVNENGSEDQKPKEKKTRTKNNWRMKRAVDNGPMYETNEARYPLPEIGSHVIVCVRETYARGYGEDRSVRGVWQVDDSCRDAWNAPIVYEVMEYKYGIDKPTLKGNAVRLEAKMRSGLGTWTRTLPTVSISNGYYRLLEREHGEQFFKKFRVNSKDCPVAELGPRVRKKKEAEEKAKRALEESGGRQDK